MALTQQKLSRYKAPQPTGRPHDDRVGRRARYGMSACDVQHDPDFLKGY